MTEIEINKVLKATMRDKIKSDSPYLRMATHPTKSVTMGGIRNTLDQWAKGQGWLPDVVCIDYADILAPAPGFTESRDAVNANWAEMRKLSQELHCLMVTATQANASSFKADQLDMSMFSEDNRKFAHVTGMIGINQIASRKKIGVQSLNWIVLREDEFVVQDHVYVAGCLGIANPCVRSVA